MLYEINTIKNMEKNVFEHTIYRINDIYKQKLLIFNTHNMISERQSYLLALYTLKFIRKIYDFKKLKEQIGEINYDEVINTLMRVSRITINDKIDMILTGIREDYITK